MKLCCWLAVSRDVVVELFLQLGFEFLAAGFIEHLLHLGDRFIGRLLAGVQAVDGFVINGIEFGKFDFKGLDVRLRTAS